jgi:hypothetical protein
MGHSALPPVAHRSDTGAMGATVSPTQVRYESDAVVVLPELGSVEVRIELVGGRDLHSVGGRIAESPRWWHGRLHWQAGPAELGLGLQVRVQLDNGRTGVARIEAVEPECEGVVRIRGVGPPPFGVP